MERSERPDLVLITRHNSTTDAAAEPAKPKLLGQVRDAIRARHYARRTERAYVGDRRVSASTQNQALAAILFLYKEVLDRDLPWLGSVIHAKRPERLPVVLTRPEVAALLRRLAGPTHLIACLLYGAGLRLLECLELRVKDIDPSRHEIRVRDGKGRKDRITTLPATVLPALAEHLERVRAQHRADLASGAGFVVLPALPSP